MRPPKDPCAWLRNWSVVVKKAAVHSIVTANKPWTWIISFIKIIKYWKLSWESSYGATYRNKVKACTLFFKQITSDFENELDKVKEKGKGRIAKGFFGLTFDRVRDNKDSIERKALSLRKRERTIIIY